MLTYRSMIVIMSHITFTLSCIKSALDGVYIFKPEVLFTDMNVFFELEEKLSFHRARRMTHLK